MFPGTNKMRVTLLIFLAFLLAAGFLFNPASGGALAPEMEPLPDGVRVETVLDGMNSPVSMVFDPNGRLFYTEKTGAVRLFESGKLQAEPVITFRVNSGTERGLTGIALDPDFPHNRYIYVSYTCDEESADCLDYQNRVVRFVERGGKGSDPTVLFTSPQWSNIHATGSLRFGPDGKLYFGLGEGGHPHNSQSLRTKQGKMHRINPDGSAPNDNPRFRWSGALPTIYAMGLRNSFDFTFDPLTPRNSQGYYRIFASENGALCDDEMNRIEAGGNYGWRPDYPCDDATTPDPYFNTISPLWYAPNGECCYGPTGIEVYMGEQMPEWKGHLFMASFNTGALFHFTLNEDRSRVTSTRVVQGIKANLDVLTGPDGALYYIEGGGYTEGALRRLVRSGTTRTPGRPIATSPASAPTPIPAPSIPGEGTRTFPETGIEVQGLFLQFWNSQGGLLRHGFPISPLLRETSPLDGKSYAVQYFERSLFEHHPENEPPYNVLLSQLGTFRYREKYPNGAPDQRPNNRDGSVHFIQTGKRLGGLFLDHWQKGGGLAHYGFPITDEFQERSDLDGKNYTVQYFERAVFELHPELEPPYDVLLSQLGTFRFNSKYGAR